MFYGAAMRITTKLILIISTLLILLFAALALNSYRADHTLIVNAAVDKARIISQQIIETREYLSATVTTSIAGNTPDLIPQVAATKIARQITRDTPYYVRQVSLRFRNPDNRPDDYETLELRRFTGSSPQESYRIVPHKGKDALRYLLPMKAEKSCLVCHASYSSSPSFVQKRFPEGHPSYGYREGEIIGAISVSVPMSELNRTIRSNLAQDLLYEILILGLLLLATGLIIHRAILAPVSKVATGIAEATRAGNFATRIAARGQDEVGRLVESFNELMAELERRTRQRAESDERYRNFIEIAQSPIVTFLPDGKIVIANKKAEKLFGLSREELLGQCIFDFMADPSTLRQGLEDYFTAGSSQILGSANHQILRDVCGREMECDIVISVSQSEHEAMFTAILRTTRT